MKTMHRVLNPRDDIDHVCYGKKKEEDSPALTITSIRLYDDLKTT